MSLRFKRNYKLLVLLALVAVVMVAGFGNLAIVAYGLPTGQGALVQSTGYGSDAAQLAAAVARAIQGLP